jgi:HK97 family phage prohead protease
MDAPKARQEFRALGRAPETRDDGGALPTMIGTLAVFDEWTEINSRSEGHFLERIAPSAFTRTIKNNLGQMRVLFQHGKDPQIGDKPLGPIASIEARDGAVHYEVPLLDTSYNRDIAALLEAGVLGSSFRFEALKDDWKRRPGKSDYNPRGLDERTVQEVRMPEFGPVTFPAYQGTSAGLRSLTDQMSGIEERVDVEDLSCLAQMIQLGACYVTEQDETDDAQNVPRMEAILVSLAELVPIEAAEVEPVEDEPDAEMASKDERAEEGDPDVDARTEDRPALLHPIRLEPREPAPLYSGQKEKPKWLI